MILVSCPKCKNRMKYAPVGNYLVGKRKRCVYCGKTFQVHTNARDSRIV